MSGTSQNSPIITVMRETRGQEVGGHLRFDMWPKVTLYGMKSSKWVMATSGNIRHVHAG